MLLGHIAWQGWQEVRTYSLHFRIGPLAMSAFFLTMAFLNGALGWHLLLCALGTPNSAIRDMTDWLRSQISKYLPVGTLWYYGGRFLQARQAGLKSGVAFLALALEFILYVIGAFVYAGLSIGLYSRLTWRWLVILVAVVSISCWVCFSLGYFIRGRFRFRQKRSIGKVLTPKHILIIRLSWMPLFYLLNWMLVGQAMGCLFASLHPATPAERFVIGGAYSLSSVLGYLFFFIPGGWGVRESILALLINNMGLHSLSAVFSILTRLWYISIEGCCALIGWVISDTVRLKKAKHLTDSSKRVIETEHGLS